MWKESNTYGEWEKILKVVIKTKTLYGQDDHIYEEWTLRAKRDVESIESWEE